MHVADIDVVCHLWQAKGAGDLKQIMYADDKCVSVCVCVCDWLRTRVKAPWWRVKKKNDNPHSAAQM